MPRRDDVTMPGFYSAFDITPWAGVAVCTVGIAGAPTITVPTIASGDLGATDADDVGEFLDVIEALTGFGSDATATLGGRLTSTWASLLGGGTIGATIGDDDRLVITNGGVSDLILHPAPGNAAWGVPAAGITIAGGSSATMTGDWQRGVTDPDDYLIIQRDGAPDQVPVVVHRVQDRRIALRARSVPEDADDRARWCLEDGDDTTRWGVTADGRAWWATTRSGLLNGMTWDSTTFRDRIGFTGDEGITTWGDGAGIEVRGQVADHPLPGVGHPTRPLRRQNRRVEIDGTELRLVSAAYSGVHIGTYRGWTIELWIDGPLDSGLDLHAHWLDMMSDPAFCTPGRPITIYQDVGDSRRALDPRSVNADQPAYDLLYTSEFGPYRGRLLCRVNPATGRDLELAQEGRYRRRYPVTITVDDREEGA